MMSSVEASRLPFKRIVVTKPPTAWFHGIARSLFDLYRQALLELGLAVFDVPVDIFLPPDVARIAAVLADIRAFQPDVAFGLSQGPYALICQLPAQRDGWRPNLFTEMLDIPTICVWDHPPLELADQLLIHPAEPAASTGGAIETLRRTLTHPRLIHWSRDSGQTRIMRELGFLLPGHVIHEPSPSLPGFVPRDAPVKTGAGFIGHFYQEPAPNSHPALDAVTRETLQTWSGANGQALWDVLMHQLAGMDPQRRRDLALYPDQTFFWHYAHRLITHRAQTVKRLKVLGAAGIPVTCYGNLRTDLPDIPENLLPVPGQIPFGSPLASALARHSITIDVMNPGFVHGYSHKPILGFASGGFLLMDRKRDFLDAFGDAGEAASYHDAEDLGAKVEGFLSNPGYRREVGDAIREQITARFQLKDVLRRILYAASECMESRAPSRTPAIAFSENRPATTVMSLLPGMRTNPEWEGASVEHSDRGARVRTAPEAWAYAAAIRVPPSVSAMHEPHLRVSLRVEVGRIGLAAMCDDTGALLAEQLVSPTTHAITVIVELPHQGAANVILRNTHDGSSRALVFQAILCDRAD